MSTKFYAIGLAAASMFVVVLFKFGDRTPSRSAPALSVPVNSAVASSNSELPVRITDSVPENTQKGTGSNAISKDRSLSPSLERALAYRDARGNVNFDEREFIVSILKEENLFVSIANDLKNIDYLVYSIPNEEFYFNTKPKALMARLATLDILRTISEMETDKESVKKAKNTLIDLVAFSIPRDLPEHIKKILVSEKYDALSIIAQYDPEAALTAFKSIANPIVRGLLSSALDEGFSKAIDSQKVTELRQELARFQSKT